MRRIDVLIIGTVVFAIGGAGYLGLKSAGLDSIDAGIWSQLVLVGIVLAWSFSYVFRVATKNMTYNQQRREHEAAVIQQRYNELTPEQLAKLQAEIEQEKQQKSSQQSAGTAAD
jgi:phosphotransferase system  glucose/maltose/N-acetylglucosamine-specific IIC component